MYLFSVSMFSLFPTIIVCREVKQWRKHKNISSKNNRFWSCFFSSNDESRNHLFIFPSLSHGSKKSILHQGRRRTQGQISQFRIGFEKSVNREMQSRLRFQHLSSYLQDHLQGRVRKPALSRADHVLCHGEEPDQRSEQVDICGYRIGYPCRQ